MSELWFNVSPTTYVSGTVKFVGGISFHVMVENRKYLKDTLPFCRFSCFRIEIDSYLQ